MNNILRKHAPYLATATAVLAYVWVQVHLPLAFLPGATHDDGLFMEHAKAIVNGHWLGPYSQYAPMKGPGYPLFLAMTHVLHTPVVLAQSLLYCLAVLFVTFATRKLFHSTGFAVLTFFLLLWDFAHVVPRIVRDSIVSSVYLLFLSTMMLGLFVYDGHKRTLNISLAGLAFGFLWITREDAITAVPLIAMLFLCFLFTLRTRDLFSDARRTFVTPLVIFAGGFSCVLVVPCSLNLAKYDQFALVDLTGDFQQALGSVQSVKPHPSTPQLAVSQRARHHIYRISPTFAQLRSLRKDPTSPLVAWKDPGPLDGQTSGDYAAVYFLWAFRDAVALNGLYVNPRETAAFYRSIHDEIDTACQSNQIECDPSLLPFLPHTSTEQLLQIPSAFIRAISFLSCAYRADSGEHSTW